MAIDTGMRPTSTPPERVELGDLLLRRWQPGDLDRQFAALTTSHAHLRRWMPWAEQPPTLAEQRRFLQIVAAHWPTPDGGYLYGIHCYGRGGGRYRAP